jgi:hypothetical protein
MEIVKSMWKTEEEKNNKQSTIYFILCLVSTTMVNSTRQNKLLFLVFDFGLRWRDKMLYGRRLYPAMADALAKLTPPRGPLKATAWARAWAPEKIKNQEDFFIKLKFKQF